MGLTRRIVLLLVGTFGLGAIVGGVVGIFIFLQVIGGSGDPSAPISAPTLSLDPTQPGDSTPAATGITEAAVLAAQTLTPAPTAEPTLVSDPRLFRIVPEESEVRFIVDELMPLRNGLVGSTNQVAGDILVDLNQPSNSRIGAIRINLRTLRTDDSRRDQALRGEVLLSARPEYEFSDFVPTAISGLPDSVTVGQPINFQVTGEFPVRGVTRLLTFAVTATLVSETQLEGLGTTTINRADYGLLQSALADHGVSEEVKLEIEFVARVIEE